MAVGRKKFLEFSVETDQVKKQNLKCNNGVRYKEHDDCACLQIRKCLVVNKKAGRGCGDRFFQLFCRTAVISLPDFNKSVGQV